MENIKLFYKFLTLSIKAQMQHRASFFLLTFAHFISTFVDIVGIWVLFDRFKMIQGWTLAELAMIYGIIHMGFAVAEGLFRGFDTFSSMVKSGDFDRFLLRPCSTLFQVATREFSFMRIGRFFQGLVVLSWSLSSLQLPFFSLNGLIIALAVIGTACLFSGLFVLQATLSFWTTETLELMNITTYGGAEAGQYPVSIYPFWLRWIFTLLIPLACVGYYPVAVLLHQSNLPLWAGFFFPLTGIAFLWISCQLWHLGVRHYRSTGN